MARLIIKSSEEKYAKNAAVISILGLLIFFNMDLDDTEETASELDSTEIVADVEAEKVDKEKELEEKLLLEKEEAERKAEEQKRK